MTLSSMPVCSSISIATTRSSSTNWSPDSVFLKGFFFVQLCLSEPQCSYTERQFYAQLQFYWLSLIQIKLGTRIDSRLDTESQGKLPDRIIAIENSFALSSRETAHQPFFFFLKKSELFLDYMQKPTPSHISSVPVMKQFLKTLFWIWHFLEETSTRTKIFMRSSSKTPKSRDLKI